MKTYYIDDLNKTVNLKFEYDSETIKQVKECDYNVRFSSSLKEWIIPVNKWSLERIINLTLSNGFTQIKKPEEESIVADYSISDKDMQNMEDLCSAKDFSYTPRKYQLECLSYSMDKGNVLNGDDVGLGKTFESILYTETTDSFPCLVIVPASVKYNWKEKWEEICGGKRKISVIESKETVSRKNDWNSDVVIINYDIIGKKQGTGATVKFKELVEKDWKMLIFDEGHFLKNKSSQRSKASKIISKSTDGKIQILTGTAITSKPIEIWNLLVILKKDHLIANSWFHFAEKYCGAYRGKFGLVTDGATNTIELNKVLRENCYIRREKNQVLSELPEMVEQVIQVPITNIREIKKATENFIKYMIEAKGEDAAEKAMSAEHLVKLNELRKLSVKGKIKSIELWLKEWKECYPEEKVVVFGVHREPLEHLSNKFKSPIINGGVSSKKKQEIVNSFIKQQNPFLFANISSAGTGVDGLQLVCSNMLVIELPWLISDLTQVKGRLHRSGQTKPPNINYMLSEETIDSDMWGSLVDMEKVTEAVNKGVDITKQGTGMKMVARKILSKNR